MSILNGRASSTLSTRFKIDQLKNTYIRRILYVQVINPQNPYLHKTLRSAKLPKSISTTNRREALVLKEGFAA